MDFMEKYNSWLKSNTFDEATKEELRAIKENVKDIEDRFYKDLEFGTGGLRGIIGAGTNRMNIYTVGKATQGLANYIIKNGEEAIKRGVAIAYDSRNMSPEFAMYAARVLAANGIKTYLFESLRSTPQLSFTVRELGTISGIVLTASHNPKEYNGYKVYWEDGGQVTDKRANEIIGMVNAVASFEDIKVISEGDGRVSGLIEIIGKEVDDKFIEAVKRVSINPNIAKELGNDLKIVYTPLHGTGNVPVRKVLREMGYENVIVVREQETPDKNFSTVKYPNPEESEALSLALKLAKAEKADVAFATDPDCDRIGVIARDENGEYQLLNGNQVGVLLTNYILSQKKANGVLPQNGAVISTIVSTKLGFKIAEDYGVDIIEVLTGFKYIGEKIKEFEATKEKEYLFGFEESYGYLAGTHARDKDAVVAAMLISEMTAYYKANGLTLLEELENIYKKYGYYKEKLKNIELKGKEGQEQIAFVISSLRKDPPKEILGKKIAILKDYKTSQALYFSSSKEEKINLPISNVLHFTLEDGSWFCVRPSGTEPKMKLYFSAIGNSKEDAEVKIEELLNAVDKVVKDVLKKF